MTTTCETLNCGRPADRHMIVFYDGTDCHHPRFVDVDRVCGRHRTHDHSMCSACADEWRQCVDIDGGVVVVDESLTREGNG